MMKMYEADATSYTVEVGDTINIDTNQNQWGFIEVKILNIVKVCFRSDKIWFYGCEVHELE